MPEPVTSNSFKGKSGMKLWGAVVVGLYVLILFALLGPLGALLFPSPNADFFGGFPHRTLETYASGNVKEVWITLLLLFVAQAALLSVPVEIASKRPVAKRTIVPMVMATSLMTALLIAGAVMSLDEVFRSNGLNRGWLVSGIFAFVWLCWGLVFFRWSKGTEPQNFVERQCRWMFRGSILELLIAVPSHIYVRQRTECCAGLETGAGIACGIAVMFFAFGPGVFWLFLERIKRLSKARG